MRTLTYIFDELTEMINQPLGSGYKPMTDEGYQISCVNDITDWADNVSSEWNGDNPGRLEDRAHIADEIVSKCNEIRELLQELEEL